MGCRFRHIAPIRIIGHANRLTGILHIFPYSIAHSIRNFITFEVSFHVISFMMEMMGGMDKMKEMFKQQMKPK
jgi:hypothetical protein